MRECFPKSFFNQVPILLIKERLTKWKVLPLTLIVPEVLNERVKSESLSGKSYRSPSFSLNFPSAGYGFIVGCGLSTLRFGTNNRENSSVECKFLNTRINKNPNALWALFVGF